MYSFSLKMKNAIKRIIRELRKHAPFTLFGALTGVVGMILCRNMTGETAHRLFYVLHPMHVVLSALVTASLYKNYRCRTDKGNCNIFMLLFIGLSGSIAVATLSDSVIPYLGELILRMPHAEPHIGFVEKWKIIVSLATIGTIMAYFWPQTKFPHAGHVLISTWASLFHIIMAKGDTLTVGAGSAIFIFLFLAVWIPCCVSDIVYPLLFVGDEKRGKEYNL